MTRIFLTGATGNVGRPVLAELLRRGYAVTALSRRDAPIDGCRTVPGSLAHPHSFLEEASLADGIIHLASPRSLQREAVVQQEILGTGALIDAWSRGNFVYASSQTVYGVPRAPLTESSAVDPACWYDLGKVCTEHQLRMAEPIRERGAGVSLRIALLFSAGERRRDRQFLPAVVDHCLRGGAFFFDSEAGVETYGSSFLGEEDMGRAFVDALALTKPGAYNVAGAFCTWRELIETIARLSGRQARWVVRPNGRPERGELRLPQSRSYVDAGRFRAETGFAPRQSLEETVARFLAREAVVA